MQFGCSKGKWFQASCSMLNIASRVDIACHTTSLYHSFSCQYSMSYDISISLLKKNFYKTIFSKSSREGGTLLFSKNNDGQSNMTIPFSSAVPSKYSEPSSCHSSTLRVLCLAPFSFSFQKHPLKTKSTLG
jgi:hypothetical protein